MPMSKRPASMRLVLMIATKTGGMIKRKEDIQLATLLKAYGDLACIAS